MKSTHYKARLRLHTHKLYDLCKKVVDTCKICQKRSRITHRRTVPAQLIKQAIIAFEITGVDAVGSLPLTKSGNRYLLVATT